jgi:glycosyltransferase involved in cell wall biosynthesis
MARILFVVTEDWFFCSHFLPMARAAIAAGHTVTVATRVKDHGAQIEATGAAVIPVETGRAALGPAALIGAVQGLRAVIAADRPDIVHLIALRAIAVGGLAARLAGVPRRVVAVTGLGLIGAGRGVRAHAARAAIRAFIRWVVDGPQTHFLFENPSDPATLGLGARERSRITIVGGAGIDPARFPESPLPSASPLRVALVARMLWSKGVDTAVEAVTHARAGGADVTLDLYGAPDPENPRAIPLATLEAYGAREGVRWHGAVAQADVPAVYAAHHVALLPSRGGEGLPRTLLEGAAAGRALVTTDVPGCRDLVRDGVEGCVVPPDNVAALSAALGRLAADPARVAAMGARARARVLDGYTVEAVGRAIVALYGRLLAS